jgi:hemerythrin-like metal-binding protein
MRTLVWSTDYEIGVDVIDTDHRDIFEVMGEIRAAIAAQNLVLARPRAQEFIDMITNHIAREKELLVSVGQEDTEEHDDFHDKMLEKAHALKRLSDNPDGRAKAELLFDDLAELVLENVEADQHFRTLLDDHLDKQGASEEKVGDAA